MLLSYIPLQWDSRTVYAVFSVHMAVLCCAETVLDYVSFKVDFMGHFGGIVVMKVVQLVQIWRVEGILAQGGHLRMISSLLFHHAGHLLSQFIDYLRCLLTTIIGLIEPFKG